MSIIAAARVMIPRTLEPEVMDSSEEALDYNSMDHGDVNRVFVDDFLKTFGFEQTIVGPAKHFLDVGTGTALIPIELCRRYPACVISAIDLAGEMLNVAAQNVNQAGLEQSIQLERIDAKQLGYDNGMFDAVISNSIVHHIPEPVQVVQEMVRVLRPGGTLFIRDLLRPTDLESVELLVQTYAGTENPHQQKMFRESLCAALNLEEIRRILRLCRLPPTWVTQTTDRHWTLVGRLP